MLKFFKRSKAVYQKSWIFQALKERPGWFLMYVLIRFDFTRNLAIALQKQRTRLRGGEPFKQRDEASSLFINLNVAKVVESLSENGFYSGINLPDKTVSEILSFLGKLEESLGEGDKHFRTNTPSLDIDSKMAGSKKTHPMFLYPDDFVYSPIVRQIINDPKLLNIAAQYLKTSPLHIGSRLWWIFSGVLPYELERVGQQFHYDIDDYASLRFFFYLTDVNSLQYGPHILVRGSHRKKKLAHGLLVSRFISDQALIEYYGESNLVTLCGQAGFGFAEDPLIFHKGIPPEDGNRLILMIQYAMIDWNMHKGGTQLRSPSIRDS